MILVWYELHVEQILVSHLFEEPFRTGSTYSLALLEDETATLERQRLFDVILGV